LALFGFDVWIEGLKIEVKFIGEEGALFSEQGRFSNCE
jgi:hypothetical protein